MHTLLLKLGNRIMILACLIQGSILIKIEIYKWLKLKDFPHSFDKLVRCKIGAGQIKREQ